MHIPQKGKIPSFVWLIIVITLISCLFDDIVFGFRISGWAWFIPLLVSVLFLIKKQFKSLFPIRLWVPWIIFVSLCLILNSHDNGLQRTIMLLCPLVVGMAASLLPVSESGLATIVSRLDGVAVVFTLLALFKMGVLLTGALPITTGFAPQAMTASLLASLYATNYAYGDKRAFISWFQMVVIPIVALTRTAMVATTTTLPLTLAPFRIYRRVLILGFIALAGLGLFFTERVQRKMFYSGRGTLEEVRIDNPDFRTSGRSLIWESLWPQIEKEPWFGHGANAQEAYLSIRFKGISHPHNDWLRLLYDYGYVGAGIFSLCLILQIIHLWRMARESQGMIRQFFQASLSAYVPFLIFMVTDNIILYAAFFGNFHFTLMGLAYGVHRRQKMVSRPYWVKSDTHIQKCS